MFYVSGITFALAVIVFVAIVVWKLRKRKIGLPFVLLLAVVISVLSFRGGFSHGSKLEKSSTIIFIREIQYIFDDLAETRRNNNEDELVRKIHYLESSFSRYAPLRQIEPEWATFLHQYEDGICPSPVQEFPSVERPCPLCHRAENRRGIGVSP